jgi:hypothetical protein
MRIPRLSLFPKVCFSLSCWPTVPCPWSMPCLSPPPTSFYPLPDSLLSRLPH